MGSGEEMDNVHALRGELEAARQEAAANYDKFLRSRADMENFRRRLERTYADLARASRAELLCKLLPVKDDLERALQYAEAAGDGCKGLVEGVRLTQSRLEQLLAQEGVKPIEAQGKPFDPRLEEAVQSVNDPHVPDHTVVQVVRQGHSYGDDQDRVLRPAQVVVNVHDSD
jgi:molecular chaperone GrpE